MFIAKIAKLIGCELILAQVILTAGVTLVETQAIKDDTHVRKNKHIVRAYGR